MTPRERHLLNTYGITEKEYDKMLKAQKGVCFICGSPAKTRALSVDHEHVPKYAKMPKDEKRKYIRGALCFVCNKFFLHRGMTIPRAKKIIAYLERYAKGKVL